MPKIATQIKEQDGEYVLAYKDSQGTLYQDVSVGLVEVQRQVGEQVSNERRYHLLSLAGDARAFGAAVRSHWGVENALTVS